MNYIKDQFLVDQLCTFEATLPPKTEFYHGHLSFQKGRS